MKKNGIVIAGTGEYAMALYDRYKLTDRNDEIAFFLSSYLDGKKNIDDKYVYTIEEKKGYLKGKDVIIAEPSEKSDQIVEALKTVHVGSLTTMTDDDYLDNDVIAIELCKNLPVQRNKVVFYCYSGRGYSCNCKYIAESLLKEGGFELVWVVDRTNSKRDVSEIPDGIKCVEIYSVEYYKEVCSAAVVVSNKNACPKVVKRPEQYYINTWYGIGPFKTYGVDDKSINRDAEKMMRFLCEQDVFDLRIAASNYCAYVYRHSLKYHGEILKCGYPRNDIFFGDTEKKEIIRKKLKIKDNQKVVMYAPTFRGGAFANEDAYRYYNLNIIDVKKALEERFSSEFVVLYRLHKSLRQFEWYKNNFGIGMDVADYVDSQELLAVTDVLITDYSSIMWDFSLTGKPVFLYQSDLEEYSSRNGFYLNPSEWPYPKSLSNEQLCSQIIEFEETVYGEKLQQFMDEYGTFDDGNASRRIIDRIKDVSQNPEKYGKLIVPQYNVRDEYYIRCTVPKVSIIVPAYNAERYIKKCVDSVLRQTLRDIEVICVDDGSVDSTASILDELAQKDYRVRVIHKINEGYGKAINVGVDNARGKYIGIVEADDTVLLNMYKKLYVRASKYELDLVKAQCYHCWDSVGYRYTNHVVKMEPYYEKVLTSADRSLFFLFFMNTWSGIYRTDFLKKYGIKHNESPGASFQDNGFWMQTMSFAERAMWITDNLYLYRRDNEGSSINGQGKPYAMLEEYKWVEDCLRKKHVPESTISICHYWRLYRHRGNLRRISDGLKREFMPVIVSEYNDYSKELKIGEDESIVEWYRGVVTSPQEYCENIIVTKNQICRDLDKVQNIYIFAAYYYRHIIKQILIGMGLSDKLKAIILDGALDEDRIGLTPVKNLYDMELDYENAAVIVYYDRSIYEGEVDKVKALGCVKVIDGHILMDTIYSC
ncbi:CDP-glycerol glycerophosphotransferase family protein [Butyrivibrio sp. AE2032]|uniref:CDP-glycerol glycerophosphotransferase family protein n=1 Tax=Butyrivibrio sp. AE2032 TaxID=1458463 RepID=UPI00068FBDD3|nr:CDP-glycerol glycerophosphotransferase family protein [Butyrivibrio sp. AE2032]